MKEFEIIKTFFRPLTKAHSLHQHNLQLNSFNLQDDVASIVSNKNSQLIISKDIFIENVHFLKSDGAEKIASKLLLSNISDIASSGATPIGYVLGFTKNSQLDKNFYSQFATALKKIQRQYGLKLIGGDTSQSDQLFYSITIFGEAPKKQILLRENAQIGDLIMVSNTIGDAFLGLNIKLNSLTSSYNLKPNLIRKLLDKHYYPQPRVTLGQKLLAKNLSRCATDISDGLVADLTNICNASRLDAQIFLDKIPLSVASQSYLKHHQNVAITDLITGGDDYELIFTIKNHDYQKILKLEKELNLPLTCIGEFVAPSKNSHKSTQYQVKIFENTSSSKPIIISKKGYEH